MNLLGDRAGRRGYESVPNSSEVEEQRRGDVNTMAVPLVGLLLGVVVVALGLVSASYDVVPSSGFRSTFLASGQTAPKKARHYRAQAIAGLQLPGYPSVEVQHEYDKLVRKIDWDDVEADLQELLTNSQEWWPADYGSYGGLMIRLSWHSCGSYRTSDGRGGCDGGGQRYVR
jgi:hypothetical protein